MTPPPASGPTPFVGRRPESVLVLVHTIGGDVLLLERAHPRGFWQSVTGTLETGEEPAETARRELLEETGIRGEPEDLATTSVYEIAPAWRARYADGVTQNREYLFRLELPARRDVILAPDEHVEARWLPALEAIELATSHTNRAAIHSIVLPLTGKGE